MPQASSAAATMAHAGADSPDNDRLALLEAIIAALPVGVSVEAGDGRLLLENPAAAALKSSRYGVEAGGEPAAVENEVRLLGAGADAPRLTVMRDVSEQVRIETELFDRAYLDELTRLPNRSLIEQSTNALIDAAGPGTTFALAFIDLDGFKHINDYYSHAVGDALLVRIANRLAPLLRPSDMLARVGGDEFVLLIAPIGDVTSTVAELEGLLDRLKQPFYIEGHEIFASASMGISLYPAHGSSYDQLRRNADSAMYRAKDGVKGGALLFTDSMAQAATARMAIEQRLRLAIRDRRFCCAFQPKVDLRTEAVIGLEVLLRWRDEEGEIRAPGDFVGLAVELGLINEIAHIVLAETVRSLELIDDAFGDTVKISLNVAAKQAEDVDFMLGFVEALAESGCAHRFMVELTEEAFFAKSRFQADVLPQLRALGVGVSIDDFGVGYSSLSALADITADEIKIDRSFITDIHCRPRSQSILKAIESLATSLGMSIVAEGIETFEELAYLTMATGIRIGQGYYFAKPMFLDTVARPARPADFDLVVAPGRAPATLRAAGRLRGG